MAGMDAKCRRLRRQPGAPSSDNNTGKCRENSPRDLKRQTDRESGRVLPKKINDAEMLRGNNICFSKRYPRPPGPVMMVMWCVGVWLYAGCCQRSGTAL